MRFESFYKEEKEKILLSKQCGTYDYPFSFFETCTCIKYY